METTKTTEFWLVFGSVVLWCGRFNLDTKFGKKALW